MGKNVQAPCPTCFKIMRQDNIKRHLKVHLKQKKKCQFCYKSFNNLIIHHKFCNQIKFLHDFYTLQYSDFDFILFKCKICNITVEYEKNLTIIKHHLFFSHDINLLF